MRFQDEDTVVLNYRKRFRKRFNFSETFPVITENN